MINDRSWTIIACSAKDGEGKDYWHFMHLFIRVERGFGMVDAKCWYMNKLLTDLNSK